MVNVKRIKCGKDNCFLIQGKDSSILVDTSKTKYRDKILSECKKVKLIILTHGHIDHVQNAKYLSQKLNVPIAMHKSDYEIIKNNMLRPIFTSGILGNMILAFSKNLFKHGKIDQFKPSIFLQEEDSLQNYGIDATIIELPGHTKGSIGIVVEKKDVIVGDALMNVFYPTMSVMYENKKEVEDSALKISKLGDVLVHFGHGKSVLNKNWLRNKSILKERL